MSRDNWERLVEAVIRREELRELCYASSRSTSICSHDDDSSSDYSFPDAHNRLSLNSPVNKPGHLLRSNTYREIQDMCKRILNQTEKKPELRIRIPSLVSKVSRPGLLHSRFIGKRHNFSSRQQPTQSTQSASIPSTDCSGPQNKPEPKLQGTTSETKHLFLLNLASEHPTQSHIAECSSKYLLTNANKAQQPKDLNPRRPSFNPSAPWKPLPHSKSLEYFPKPRQIVSIHRKIENGLKMRGSHTLSKEIRSPAISPVGSKCKELSNDSDSICISEILRASHYPLGDRVVFRSPEKQQYLMGKDICKVSRLQRKLILDTINEILDRINRYRLPPCKVVSWTNYDATKPSLDKVWSEFQSIRERDTAEDLFETICGVLKKDLAGDEITGWGDCPIEMSKVILDIERLIFKDLISETIRDLAALASRNTLTGTFQIFDRHQILSSKRHYSATRLSPSPVVDTTSESKKSAPPPLAISTEFRETNTEKPKHSPAAQLRSLVLPPKSPLPLPIIETCRHRGSSTKKRHGCRWTVAPPPTQRAASTSKKSAPLRIHSRR